MKPRRKQEAGTAKDFLRQLAEDKGPVLTEQEYESVRSWQLRTLAKPPRIEWAIAAPGLAFLVGVGFLVTALLTWITTPEDSTMNRLMMGVLLAGVGSYFFFGNFRICGAGARRSHSERKAEIDDLLRSGLITSQEHETIRQAIHHKSVFRSQNEES
jgi:hypothetical protein